MLTQTTLNGIFCIRFAVGATRTNEGHIQDAYDIIIEEAKSTIETWDQTISGVVSAQLAPQNQIQETDSLVPTSQN